MPPPVPNAEDWSPLDALTTAERLHAVILLALTAPDMSAGAREFDSSIAGLADFLRTRLALHAEDIGDHEMVTRIAKDLCLGLRQPRRMLTALLLLRTCADRLRLSAVATGQALSLDVSDPLASPAPQVARTSLVTAADALFVQALDHLHDTIRIRLMALAPGDRGAVHGNALARIKVLALATRSSLTGQPIDLVPGQASSPSAALPASASASASAFDTGWQDRLAMGEVAWRRMAELRLMPGVRTLRPAQPMVEALWLFEATPPLAAIKARTPELTQRLDRDPGTLHFLDAHGRQQMIWQVGRLDDYLTEGVTMLEACQRQSRDLLALEGFALRQMQEGQQTPALLPRELHLLDGVIGSGPLRLATRNVAAPSQDLPAPATWRLNREAIAALDRLSRTSPAYPSSHQHGWSDHGLDLPPLADPAVPAAPPSVLRLIFQLEDTPEAFTAAWLLTRKHAGSAAWLQQSGELRAGHLRVGRALIDAAGPDTEVKITLIGRSGIAPDPPPGTPPRQALSGWLPAPLVHRLDWWLTDLGLADCLQAAMRLDGFSDYTGRNSSISSDRSFGSVGSLVSNDGEGVMPDSDSDSDSSSSSGSSGSGSSGSSGSGSGSDSGRATSTNGSRVDSAGTDDDTERRSVGAGSSSSGFSLFEPGDPFEVPRLGPELPVVERPRITGISLVSCDLANPTVRDNFATRFVYALQSYPWGTHVPVTARTGELHVTGTSGDAPEIRKFTAHVNDDGSTFLAHRAPGDTVVLDFDHKFMEVVVTDRYGADAEVALPGGRFDAAALGLLFDVAMDGETPLALRELFGDEQGGIDRDRLVRIGSDRTELGQFLDDLRRHRSAGPEIRPGPSRLPATSLAGRVVRLAGRDLPVQFLDSFDARIDGTPLRSAPAGASEGSFPTDLADRLTLDAGLLTQLLPHLPDDAASATRLEGLAAWLHRGTAPDATPPLHGRRSKASDDLVARILRVPVDRSGRALDRSAWITAAHGDRPPQPAASSLMADILSALSPQGRSFLEGANLQTVQAIRPVEAPGTTPLERVMTSVAADLGAIDTADPAFPAGRADALAELRAQALVGMDANGVVRLDAGRLAAMAAGGNDKALLRAASRMLDLPDTLFERLSSSPDPDAARWLERARAIRSSLRRPGRGDRMRGRAGMGMDAVNTVLGAFQLAQNWRSMSAPMVGLSLAQLSSFAVSPLAGMFGTWLSGLGTIGRHRVLGIIAQALAGGAVDIGLAALGLIVIGLQWAEFNQSRQGTDSFAYRSLVANTALVGAFTTMGLSITGPQLAAFLAGGAKAAAGTVAGVAAQAALPLALAAIAVHGTVNSLMWVDEYGDHFHPSTSMGDAILAGLALFFGFSTDATRRAETAKHAGDAARHRSQHLRRQWQDDMAFRAAWMFKSGIGAVRVPDKHFPVSAVTYRQDDVDMTYAFALQDLRPTRGPVLEKTRSAASPAADVSVAWLDLAGIDFDRDRRWETTIKDQLFELQGATGLVRGGLGNDRFILGPDSAVEIHGNEGVDEVIVDAGHQQVHLDTDGRAWRIGVGRTMRFARMFPERFHDIERLVVRHADSAIVTGGPHDEWFDVSAREGVVAGGGGRNTYVLHAGVQIRVTSDDLLVWRRDLDAVATLADAPPAARLAIQVDGTHETLEFRRSGQDLLLRAGTGVLTLKDLFLHDPRRREDPVVTVVDALGLPWMPTALRALGDSFTPMPSLPGLLVLGARTPDTRRSLGGTFSSSRYRLLAGAGDFHLAARTVFPIEVMLDVTAERLRYRHAGDDLIIEECTTQDTARNYRPLTLTLPDFATTRRAHAATPVLLSARAGSGSSRLVPLALPAVDDTTEGAMRTRAVDARGPTSPRHDTPRSAELVLSGDAQDNLLDGGASPDADVWSGGEGADTYLIPASRSIVIDNLSNDAAPDAVRLVGDLGSLRFERDGDDLVVATDVHAFTARRHAVDPRSRHLRLSLDDTSAFALPAIHPSGIMVYDADAGGDVPGFVPGVHLVLPRPDAAWAPPVDGPRRVIVPEGAIRRQEGASLEISAGIGDTRSVVLLLDYYRAPEHFQLVVQSPGEFRVVPGRLPERSWRRRPEDVSGQAVIAPLLGSADADLEMSRMVNELAGKPAPGGPDYAPATVRTWFRLKGLPPDIAQALHLTTSRQVRRAMSLLAVASTARINLPAAYIQGHATGTGETALSAPRHGPLLGHLVRRERHWSFAARVLALDLTLDEILVFDTWADKQRDDEAGPDGLCEGLDEFAALLAAAPHHPLVTKAGTAALLEAVLRSRGRSDDAAKALAAAMTAIGTMDEAWVDGMQRVGVVDHDMLKALHDAKITAEDLELGNANRLAYEHPIRRSGLIRVSAHGAYGRTIRATRSRLVSRKYLRQDDRGEWFDRADAKPEPGVHYDLFPGELILPYGPGEDVATVASRHDSIKHQPSTGQWYSHYPFQTVESNAQRARRIVPDPSARWREAGLAEIVSDPPTSSTSWWGRSRPENLVDGSHEPGEATAWRPYIDESDPGFSLDLLERSPRGSPLLELEFRHAVALAALHVSVAPTASSEAPHQRGGVGRFVVDAIRADGASASVSPEFSIDGGTPVDVQIDTRGLPYRKYRLRGVGGHFPLDAWITEISFTTVEAGIGPLAERLRRAGYSPHDARTLQSLGVQGERAVTRAVRLREDAVVLSPTIVAREVLDRPAMSERQRHWMRLLRRQGMRPEEALRLVRDTGSPSQAARLRAAVLPHGTWGEVAIDADLLRSFRPQVVAWLRAWRQAGSPRVPSVLLGELADSLLAAAGGDARSLGRAILLLEDAMPGAPGSTAAATNWGSLRMAELLSSDPAQAPRPLPWSVAIVGEVLARLADGLHAGMETSAGQPAAVRATLPLFIQSAAMARPEPEGRHAALWLTWPIGESPQDEAVRAVMRNAAGDLQQAEDAGLLDVDLALRGWPKRGSGPDGSWARWTFVGADDAFVSRLPLPQAIQQAELDVDVGQLARLLASLAAMPDGPAASSTSAGPRRQDAMALLSTSGS